MGVGGAGRVLGVEGASFHALVALFLSKGKFLDLGGNLYLGAETRAGGLSTHHSGGASLLS